MQAQAGPEPVGAVWLECNGPALDLMATRALRLFVDAMLPWRPMMIDMCLVNRCGARPCRPEVSRVGSCRCRAHLLVCLMIRCRDWFRKVSWACLR